MKILITGAAGYVGSALARLLIQRNYDVALIDNYSTPSNVMAIENQVIFNKDICELEDLSHCDVLFHLAAISGIRRCDEDKAKAYATNVKGTYHLLSKLNKNARFIFASTSAVYGEAQHPAITEMHPAMPKCHYGHTKLEAECIVKLHDNYTILRFSNIYGRGIFNKRTVIDSFIDRACEGQHLEIDGDGKQCRDFVHINDALRAYWQAMRNGVNGTYNIGGNEALSVNGIAELVVKQYRQLTGVTLNKYYNPKDTGRAWKDIDYSSEMAKQHIGYEPSHSVSDEVRERIRCYLQAHAPSKMRNKVMK